MKPILIFTSGTLTMATAYWLYDPLCGLASWFVGFAMGALVMGVTAFIGGSKYGN
jgi:hypothetical protein